MFERLTDRARKVMALADQEAQRFNHEYIGTEHILLGLIKEGSGVGATVLKNMGLDLLKLRTEVEKRVKSGPDITTIHKLPQTPCAKKVIEYAIEEARSLNHNYVGTEHLLLGLLHKIKDSQGKYQYSTAGKILRSFGLTFGAVRAEVMNLLGVEEKKKKHNIKKVATKKKQRPVKCKIFYHRTSEETEETEKIITDFLKKKIFVQAMQSGNYITIFYKER